MTQEVRAQSPEDIDTFWEKSGADDPLWGATTFQSYVDRLKPSTFEPAFVLADRSLRCMDERTPGGIHFAGSGILLPLEDALSGAKSARVDGVYSHEDCRAVKLYVSQNNLSISQTEHYAKERAQALASYLGVPYKGYLGVSPSFHIARAAYYAGVDFDPMQVAELPEGFVVSRNYYSNPAYAKAEFGMTPEIALGNHGFGERFAKHTPFYLVAVGKDEKHLASLVKEIEAIPFAKEVQDRIKIDGFVAKI